MFNIPSLKESVQRVRQEFRANLPGSDAWAWPNNINPTAKVFGGIAHELFGFMDYIQRQKFAITADTEGLDMHGEEYGLARKPASPARGNVTVEVSAATTFAAGARFRRVDGMEYIAVNGGSSSGAATFQIDCVANADGKAANAIADTPLEIVSGMTGDESALAYVAAGGIVGGLDVEDDEAFRARILFRKRNPPHGGSAADYVMWASEVSGVTRVFVERLWNGPGTVRVFPLMDDLYPNGIPQPGDIDRIADHLEYLRPAGAIVSVAIAEAVPIDVTITGLQPSTTDVQEAVRAELKAAFFRNSRVAGYDVAIGGMPYLASPASFSRSWIWQAAANATGEQRHIVGLPSVDRELSRGQMAVLGNVAFAFPDD